MVERRSEGWYPDPDDPDRLRWFDGENWGRVEPLDDEPGPPPDATFWSAIESAPAKGPRSRWTGPLMWSPLLAIPLLLAGRATRDPALALGAVAVLFGWLAQVAINAVNARRQPPQPPLPAAVSVLPLLLIVCGVALPWFFL